MDCNDLSNIDFWKRVIRLSEVEGASIDGSIGAWMIVSLKKYIKILDLIS